VSGAAGMWGAGYSMVCVGMSFLVDAVAAVRSAAAWRHSRRREERTLLRIQSADLKDFFTAARCRARTCRPDHLPAAGAHIGTASLRRRSFFRNTYIEGPAPGGPSVATPKVRSPLDRAPLWSISVASRAAQPGHDRPVGQAPSSSRSRPASSAEPTQSPCQHATPATAAP